MKPAQRLDKIDLQLIRTLHTVLVQRSVSKAALALGQQQPVVSRALRRLRALTGDEIVVRSGATMVPTEAALQMLEPAAQILQLAETMFARPRRFDAANASLSLRIAAADTLDPLFLPAVVARIKSQAPNCSIEVQALSAQSRYAQDLAEGLVDVVIGNWAKPSAELHRALLFEDEIVCLVSDRHPAVRRGWSQDEWLACQHIAPTAAYQGWRGIVDEQLDALGLSRQISARCAYFGLIPRMVANSLLVLTTGRQYCQSFLQGPSAVAGLTVLTPPVRFAHMVYYQLWHDRSHSWPAGQWLREQVRISAAALAQGQGR